MRYEVDGDVYITGRVGDPSTRYVLKNSGGDIFVNLIKRPDHTEESFIHEFVQMTDEFLVGAYGTPPDFDWDRVDQDIESALVTVFEKYGGRVLEG